MKKLHAWLIGGYCAFCAVFAPVAVYCDENEPDNSFDDIKTVEHITNGVTSTPTPTEEIITFQTLSLEAEATPIPIEELQVVEVHIPTCTPIPTPLPTEIPYEEQEIEPEPTEEPAPVMSQVSETVSASDFKFLGKIYWGDWYWTWYSDRVLSGGGLNIPGRHYDESNFICDENDYICLASDVLPYGTVIDTPFGKQGKIYDCGVGSDFIVDVYVHF